MLNWIIGRSVRYRTFVLIGTGMFVGLGVWSLTRMTFDAFPDLTNVQVQVVTTSPGMPSTEVERLVTVPIERSLGGVPNLVELRSLSRSGVSSITAVFEDGTDRWLARQLVKERLDLARSDIPEAAGTPELSPPTTGLGEVYQFTLSSDRHTMPALYRVFERDVAPRLRAVRGVVEVNAWGGGEPQLDVTLDPFRLAAHGLAFSDVAERVGAALGVSAGGNLVRGAEQRPVRGTANPDSPEELGALLVGRSEAGGEVRLRDVARVRESGSLTVGLGSGDGRGEMLFVMVQLLAGADARSVVRDVRERVAEVRETLEDGVTLEPIYDRDKLVGSTLSTVTTSLVEGGALVILVLLLLLGDLRAGLVVASVIPMAMLGAFTGMVVLGYSGNLMSLGAIDFGLIVDGTIVVTESIVALTLAGGANLPRAVVDRTRSVARPVLFAVGILLLVYVPVLLLGGTEGKLFRPMALTVLLALATALLLSFTYVPALASLVIRPRGEHQTWLTRRIHTAYDPTLRATLRHPWLAAGAAATVFAVSVWAASGTGVEFVPRLEEGDLVVQTTRLPTLTPAEALREATRVERVLGGFPEVVRVASRTGSPAVATDPMGLEEADILVQLRPREQWPPGQTTEALVTSIAAELRRKAPGAVVNFTQPIEMRFNELLEGITSDVGVAVFGPDLDELARLGQAVAAELGRVEGAADVAAPVVEGVAGLDVDLRPDALARYGVEAGEVLRIIAGLQRGHEVGSVTRGAFRDAVVLKLSRPDDLPLAELPVVLPSGLAVPLGELAEIRPVTGPATVSRLGGSRRLIVEANVRGRDVGSFVQEAHERVGQLELPRGYWLEWSGKYEQLRAASSQMAVVVPIVLLAIFGVLYVNFRSWPAAALIFLNVPVAASGGMLLLWARGMPVSMSAIVGFIALFGIAVMNGIVLVSRTQELRLGMAAARAAAQSALERFRPVLMTAAVAGIGFLPMAIAQGVGAEVQRPLATVVIGGLVTSTLLTLLVLPSLYARVFRRRGGDEVPEHGVPGGVG